MAKIEQKMVSNNTNASKSRKSFWTESKSEVEKNGTGDGQREPPTRAVKNDRREIVGPPGSKRNL